MSDFIYRPSRPMTIGGIPISERVERELVEEMKSRQRRRGVSEAATSIRRDARGPHSEITHSALLDGDGFSGRSSAWRQGEQPRPVVERVKTQNFADADAASAAKESALQEILVKIGLGGMEDDFLKVSGGVSRRRR